MVCTEFVEGRSHGELCGNDGYCIPRTTRNLLKMNSVNCTEKQADRQVVDHKCSILSHQPRRHGDHICGFEARGLKHSVEPLISRQSCVTILNPWWAFFHLVVISSFHTHCRGYFSACIPSAYF